MKKKNMCDFVNEQCEAVEDKEKFVTAWLRTHGDPCTMCEKDKSRCLFYKKLMSEVAQKEEKTDKEN